MVTSNRPKIKVTFIFRHSTENLLHLRELTFQNQPH